MSKLPRLGSIERPRTLQNQGGCYAGCGTTVKHVIQAIKSRKASSSCGPIMKGQYYGFADWNGYPCFDPLEGIYFEEQRRQGAK